MFTYMKNLIQGEINMALFKIRTINKSFGTQEILSDISFDLNEQERIGLVGSNGSGKSTLANILFGKIPPDNGVIEHNDDLKIGYLFQTVDYETNDLFENDQLVESREFLEFTSELGLSKVHTWDEDRYKTLSGGERLKLALAKIWSHKPDLLILDEPTNHLDIQGIHWLVKQVIQFEGTVMIISHDRYFLDRTVNQIFEIEHKTLTTYKGNYTAYRQEKSKRFEDRLHQYEKQQSYKKRVEAQVTNLQQWAGNAHRTMRKQEGFKEYHGVKAKKLDRAIKSKTKHLEMELKKNKIEKPTEEKKVHFQFDASGKRGKRMIEANALTKKFNNKPLFQNSYFYINYGERIGLLGPNGSGKTTFLNMLVGKEPLTDGSLWRSPSIKTAYLSQDLSDLPEGNTAIEALNLAQQQEILQARTILANMGLDEEKINQPIQSLSYGERMRVKLTGMLIQQYDLLILDEPTNHLDLHSREALEKTLLDFNGTLLIVSHDIYLLNQLCQQLLVIEENKISRVEMGLTEFQQKKDQCTSDLSGSSKDDLLVIDTEISAVLGELSSLSKEQPRYTELDQLFQELVKKKKQILTGIKS